MSARYQALYIRADTPERAARIDADVQGAKVYFDRFPPIEKGHVVYGGAGESPDLNGARMAMEASRLFGDAVYAGFQENVGSFLYVRCVEGALRRHLQYNSDSGWVTVEGTPESWEAALLFSDERLRSLLAEASDHDDPAARRAEVEAVFARKRLARGDVLPWIWADQLFYAMLGAL